MSDAEKTPDTEIIARALVGISDASVRIEATAAFRRHLSSITEDSIESLEGTLHESFESMETQIKAVEAAITTRSELVREVNSVAERLGSIGSTAQHIVELINAVSTRLHALDKRLEPKKPKRRRKRK